jgi:hypothetical protein
MNILGSIVSKIEASAKPACEEDVTLERANLEAKLLAMIDPDKKAIIGGELLVVVGDDFRPVENLGTEELKAMHKALVEEAEKADLEAAKKDEKIKPYDSLIINEKRPAVIRKWNGSPDSVVDPTDEKIYSVKSVSFADVQKAREGKKWHLALWCDDEAAAKKAAEDLNSRALKPSGNHGIVPRELAKAEKPGEGLKKSKQDNGNPSLAVKAARKKERQMAMNIREILARKKALAAKKIKAVDELPGLEKRIKAADEPAKPEAEPKPEEPKPAETPTEKIDKSVDAETAKVKELMAKHLGLDGDDLDDLEIEAIGSSAGGVDANGYRAEYGREEYYLYPEDEAVRVAEKEAENMIADEPESFNPDFINEFLYMSETDCRVYAGDMADGQVEGMDDDDIIKAAGGDYEERYEAADAEDDDVAKEKILEDAKEEAVSNITDEIAKSLMADPVGYFVDQEGIYSSAKELLENNIVSVDSRAAAKSAVAQDGVAHFIAGYDGEEIELGDGWNAYRTN